MVKTRIAAQQETFGGRLKAARKAVGLTQEKLGEVLGVTKSQVSYYESDQDAPSYDNLVKAAQTLRKTPTYLLTGTEGAEGEMIDPETYKLLVAVKGFPEALQEFVYESVRLAERTKHLIPSKFIQPPNSESWADFHAYLTGLAKDLPKEQQKPKKNKK